MACFVRLGANYHGKRAARGHFLFNALGVLWMLAAFSLFSQLVEWLALSLPDSLRTEKHTSDIGFKLAIFHTTFNLLNICLLIAFVPTIAKIVTRWVKAPPETDLPRRRLTYIQQSLVATGEMNLPAAEKAVVELAELTKEMFEGFVDVFNRPDEDLSDRVQQLRSMEDEADEMTEEITEYLVQCSAGEIGHQNATEVSQMIRIVAELETITDMIYRLVKFARRRYRKEHELTEEAVRNCANLRNSWGVSSTFTTSSCSGRSMPKSWRRRRDLKTRLTQFANGSTAPRCCGWASRNRTSKPRFSTLKSTITSKRSATMR